MAAITYQWSLSFKDILSYLNPGQVDTPSGERGWGEGMDSERFACACAYVLVGMAECCVCMCVGERSPVCMCVCARTTRV